MIENSREQILNKLKDISELGPVPSVASGANGIGKTLQHLLNIEHTVSKKNNLGGMVITATSMNSNNRTNLFAAVPDWPTSLVKSSAEILDKYGREDLSGKYEKSLFCTVNSIEPNSFGLKLVCNRKNHTLSEVHISEDSEVQFIRWDTNKLNSKLMALDKTVIVSAIKKKKQGVDYFHYVQAEILSKPDISSFFQLVDVGAITLDHLISRRFGSKAAREQGPLFKMKQDVREVLFSNYSKINLLS